MATGAGFAAGFGARYRHLATKFNINGLLAGIQ
jgi:hypothetical protein